MDSVKEWQLNNYNVSIISKGYIKKIGPFDSARRDESHGPSAKPSSEQLLIHSCTLGWRSLTTLVFFDQIFVLTVR